MTISCSDCRTCGDCYPKKAACPACGAPIDLREDACETCGAPVTDDMRAAARARFMERKRKEFVRLFPRSATMPSANKTL